MDAKVVEMKYTAKPKIALYGGAFDPVHNAHLKVARAVLDRVAADQVVFVPASRSPLKAHAPLASDADRIRMLELAIQGEARFSVDAYEIEKGGISYTVDTVRHFQSSYAASELYWIIGGDQFERLAHWHRINDLARQVSFLVLARPGAELHPPVVKGLRHTLVPAPLMPESSSEIRARCRMGLSLDGWVPDAVEAFISDRRLYRNQQ